MGGWYENEVIYSLYVRKFADADGDGVGDLAGLTERLGHLASLGVGCIWLLPILESPMRDGGYDVAHYFRLDPAIGDFGDLARLLDRADDHGIRVLKDLPINHTSRDHRWFQQARRDPDSPYRDYYIWSDDPDNFAEKLIFDGPQTTNWTWDERAGQYYYHTFYPHEPDLNVTNPAVRGEIENVMRFWLRVGFDGFRLDALAHMFREKGDTRFESAPFAHIQNWRELVKSHHRDGVLVGELDVEPWEYPRYFKDGERLDMLLNFYATAYIFLAFARQSARPLVAAFDRLPDLHWQGNWGNFLRNHDELDLQRLDDDEMQEVFDVFAPDERDRAFGRGIRRRVAPLLDDDRRRLEMAYSLILTLPGTPFLYYGQELAMGDDMALDEREPLRTPMQWENAEHGGFSRAPEEALEASVLADDRWGYPSRNVADQREDPDSFLRWLSSAIQSLKSCPEFGHGRFECLELDDTRVFAHACRRDGQLAVAAHNFSDQAVDVELPVEPPDDLQPVEIFDDGAYEHSSRPEARLSLAPFGYRWFRWSDFRRGESR